MTNEEMQVRLADYRQFVAQISEVLGVPVGEIDDSISAWQRGEFDDLAMRALLRWREETTKNDDVAAPSVDTPPTSGFFTSGRWDFTEQPKRIG